MSLKALASYADILWARHAIFLTQSSSPTNVGEEDCVTCPKNVCVAGYKSTKAAILLFPKMTDAGKIEAPFSTPNTSAQVVQNWLIFKTKIRSHDLENFSRYFKTKLLMIFRNFFVKFP